MKQERNTFNGKMIKLQLSLVVIKNCCDQEHEQSESLLNGHIVLNFALAQDRSNPSEICPSLRPTLTYLPL